MTPHIDSLVLPSVSLWLDYLLIEKNKGFANYSANLKKVGSSLNGQSAFASPHAQWVYDNSIVGAQIPTGVIKGGSPLSRGANLKLNFLQGGAFLNPDTSQTVSANYSFKEVNNYISHNSLETILFEQKFYSDPRTTSTLPSALGDFIYPCIIVKTNAGENETLDFAGNVSTIMYVRLIFLSDNNGLFQNVCGILRDSKETHLPIFDALELPFNEYGDLKNSTFDYTTVLSTIQSNARQLGYIKDVNISEFPPAVIKEMGIKAFGAFIDLDLQLLRYPH